MNTSGDPPSGPSSAEYWNQLYRSSEDGWELSRVTPPLERWLTGRVRAGTRALVIGCGRGHEARLLARLGAQVTAIDFAEEALRAARALALADGVAVDFRQLDLFELPVREERWSLVVEHTCFCAIDPERRGEYVSAVAGALEPGGELVGLFYAHRRPGGPPFSVTDEQLLAFFEPRFKVLHREIPSDSIERRAGDERLLHLVKR